MLTKTKLPRTDRKHPLLIAVNNAQLANISIRAFARDIGIPPQNLHRWIAQAKEDRDFMLPAHYVACVCRLTGQLPYNYRPDVFLSKWEV